MRDGQGGDQLQAAASRLGDGDDRRLRRRTSSTRSRPARSVQKGVFVRFHWDGRTDAGRRAATGRCTSRRSSSRTTRPDDPHAEPDRASTRRRRMSSRRATATGSSSPAAATRVDIPLRLERASARGPVPRRPPRRPQPPERGRAARSSGRARRARRPCRAGRYVLEVAAVDLAGNATPPAERKRLVVRIRDIALSAKSIHVAAGARFIGRRSDGRPALPVEVLRRAWHGARRSCCASVHRHSGAGTGSSSPSMATRRPRSSSWGEGDPVIGLARLAAPIACIGLAILLDGANAREPDRGARLRRASARRSSSRR